MPTSSLLLGPIVGGLTHNNANIWARATAPTMMEVWLATQADLKDAKSAGKVELQARDGCAGVVKLERLKPETDYFYAVGMSKVRPKREDFHRFKTFPKPGAKKSFAFFFGS